MYEVLVMIGELRRCIVWKLDLLPAALSQRGGRNWLRAAEQEHQSGQGRRFSGR